MNKFSKTIFAFIGIFGIFGASAAHSSYINPPDSESNKEIVSSEAKYVSLYAVLDIEDKNLFPNSDVIEKDDTKKEDKAEDMPPALKYAVPYFIDKDSNDFKKVKNPPMLKYAPPNFLKKKNTKNFIDSIDKNN